jgi:uncharacterized protein with PQ loop repeat
MDQTTKYQTIKYQTPKYQYIAIFSGIFTILGFSHLIFNVYKTKKTEHLTFIWILFILTSQILLFIYGILNNSYGIFIPPLILISGIMYIIYIKINYELNTKIEEELRLKNII